VERRVRTGFGKGLIENGTILDGSDTIPGHVPVQRVSAEKLEETGVVCREHTSPLSAYDPRAS